MIEATIRLEITASGPLLAALDRLASAFGARALARVPHSPEIAEAQASVEPDAPGQEPVAVFGDASGPLVAPTAVAGVPQAPLHPKGHAGCAPERVVYTPERIEVLRREWPKGTDVHEIGELLAALPGAPVVSTGAIGVRAAGLGLRRPSGHGVPPKAAPASRPMLDVSGGPPVVVDWQQMEKWAAERGISSSELYGMERKKALALVNAKRKDLGLPAFRLQAPRAHTAGARA